MQADFDRAIARVPKWMLALAAVGTGVAGRLGGLAAAGPFLVGAAASWFNFRVIERAVNRLGEAAKATPGRPPRRAGVWMFIQFAVFVLGAFVILKYSGFSLPAAFFGFLVCPAAAILELLYELLTYGHS
jgi:hypothetical protein